MMNPAVKLATVILPWPGSSGIPNLLAGKPWVQGGATLMSEVNGRMRAERAGANPRIYKRIQNFQVGATYRLLGPIYIGTSTSVFLRISDTTAINTDGPFSQSWTSDQLVDTTFVANAADQYFGLIGVNDQNGKYVEIEKDFRIEYVSGP